MDKSSKNPLYRHLFFLLMSCFAAAILGDSTAESLLLARFGPSFVPKMFLVNAAALFALSAGLLSVVDTINRRTFFMRALFVHGCILVLMRGAVAAHFDLLFLPLFSYAYSSKILFFLLFWTVANDCIDARSAGKVFPAIAAGGTIGAIVISFSISGLMRLISAENLLLVWAFLVFVTMVLLMPLSDAYARPSIEKKQAQPGSKFSLSLLLFLRDEPLVRTMALVYSLVFFILLNQHFIFYKQIRGAFGNAETIAAFLGGFNGASMLFTCLLQVTVAGFFMRKLGSTRSMLLLPSVLFCIFTVSTVITVVKPGAVQLLFFAIIAGMGVRIAFFDSFFSPNFQLFFSSLPKENRGRAKLLIEGVVKPSAMVIAGLFLLCIAPKLSLLVHCTLLALIAAAALLFTMRLKHAYTRSLTKYLTGLYDANTTLLNRLDFSGGEDFLSFFAKRIDKEEFEVQKFLVEMIASSGNEEAAVLLLDYLKRADVRLRATVVAALGNFPQSIVAATLAASLNDTDTRVVANAVSALHACRADNLEELLAPFTDHHNRRVRINAMIALWPLAEIPKRITFTQHLSAVLEGAVAEDRASVLYLTGQIIDDSTTGLLYDFCRNHAESWKASEIVRRQTVSALAKRTDTTAFGFLLDIGQTVTPQKRKAVISALSEIVALLDDKEWHAALDRGNAVHRSCILQALRVSKQQFSASSATLIGKIAAREFEAIGWEKQSLQVLSSSKSERMALLSFAIKEELLSIRCDNLLHIAALLDPSGVVAAVLPRVHHSDRHVRARAFEVLENSGDSKINRMALSCIEWCDMHTTSMQNGSETASTKELLIASTYCTSHNKWVATCAEYASEKRGKGHPVSGNSS